MWAHMGSEKFRYAYAMPEVSLTELEQTAEIEEGVTIDQCFRGGALDRD